MVLVLQHLSRFATAGHIVDFDGNDVYLPNAERLALPITLLQGEVAQAALIQTLERSGNHGQGLTDLGFLPITA